MGEKSDNGTFKEGKDFSWGWLLFFFVLLLVACIAYPFILRGLVHWMNPGKLDKYGLVGDMFGALNAFISGCAFIGVIISLYLQRQDLKLQRKDLALQLQEMREARKEAEEQTQQFKEQVEIGKRAQFYDNFYRRLELLQSLSNNVAFDATSRNNGITSVRDMSGSIAWKSIHSAVALYIQHGGDNHYGFLSHIEALSAIIAWYQTLILFINDVIQHFGEKDIASRSEALDHVRIIFNSISEYEKDFLILFMDVREDDMSATVKDYLYRHEFIESSTKTRRLFGVSSRNRNTAIKIIREKLPW